MAPSTALAAMATSITATAAPAAPAAPAAAFHPPPPPPPPPRPHPCRRLVLNRCIWYEEVRGRLPVPQPRCFWTGFEPPADAAEDFGHYGVCVPAVHYT